MKNNLKFLNIVLLLLAQLIWSQASPTVNVTVQVLPPYSTYLPDYVNSSNKVLLTLLSYTNANVKLKATITGDNGITVATSDSYRPSAPLQLTAYQSKILTGIDLRNYLEFNSVTVSGIDKRELFRGSGIPEGNYTLCVQVLDYNTGAALSSPEPLGCSNSFNIEQITPPQLITPRCDEPIMASNIQNVIFSWSPSAGAPAGSQYKLKIVELIPATRNPNEAMNSATTPAFFETTTSSYTYVYGPAQPQFKKGKKYAWRVTLLPAGVRGGTPLNTQNKGNSEVCSFEYKEDENVSTIPQNVTNGITLLDPIKGKKNFSGYGLEFSWAPSKQAVKKYQLQFTDRFTQDVKITNWNSLPENLFDLPNSFYASKDTGLNTKQTLPPSFTTGNGKIAWRIVGLDSQDKIIDKSAIEIYEVVDAPSSDRIKLISPINGKQISGGETITYSWTASKKKTVQEYLIQWKYIKNKNEVSEKLFSDTDFNGSIGPFKETQFSMKTQVDQDERMMAWRVIGISNNKIVDSSLPDYLEFVKDKSDLANLKNLIINGYSIQITKINDKNPDSYAGQGKVLLWENGPTITVWFKDLKIKPISYIAKTKSYVYAVVDGMIDMPYNKAFEYKKEKISLSTHNQSEGAYELFFKNITFKANLKGIENPETKTFKVTEDLGTTTAKITAKWYSNFMLPKEKQTGEYSQYVFESNEEDIKMTFKDRFDGTIQFKNQKLENLGGHGIEVDFDALEGVKAKIKGLTAESSLNGKVTIPKANSENAIIKIEGGGSLPNLGKLEITFKQKSNLNFEHLFAKPLRWNISKDKSVFAIIEKAYVHLSEEGMLDAKYKTYPLGLNIEKLGVEVVMPSKSGKQPSTFKLNFDKVYNNGDGYTNNKKGEEVVKSKIDVAGFLTKLQKSTFLMKFNKLYMLNVEGNMYVPFINDWVGINIFIDGDKLQDANLSFDYNKIYYLSKDKTTSAFVKISSGRFENKAIVLSPRITIKNSKNKGFETNDMSMCDLYINSDGTVSYDKNFSLNSDSACEGSKKWATYYRFTYGIDKMKIKRNASKTEAEFLFSGDINLGQNIATNSKKEMGFKYVGQAPNPNVTLSDLEGINNSASQNPNSGNYQAPKGIKGPNSEVYHYVSTLENNISISDDGKAISGGYEDGAQKFGGGFKIGHDDKWGDYFQLEGKYEAKEPTAKELESKLILGKTLESNGKFTYWFFEFKQKGMVVVPVIPGVVEIHGFGGKAYYHMKPTYDNLGQVTDLNPDSSLSLGIAATAYARTAYDNGRTLHGSVQIVTEFYDWSISGIDYYIKADAIAENSNSSGMLQARLNGSLNWKDKYINGKGQIWGKVKDIVCLNEGQTNEDSIFFQFGGGEFKINIGTESVPITAEVMCGSGLTMGVWFNLSKTNIELGVKEHYDSGWKGLNLHVASAQGKLVTDFSAGLNIQYSPSFQATGNASFSGRAYGKGCVKYIGCISGSCGVGAKLAVTMPNPVVFEGSVSCDVSRWIPDFTLHARWSSNGGFSIWV